MEVTAELPPSFAEKHRTSAKRVSADHAIKLFFGSNALVATVVLALITIFLFREGFGFFGQNLANIRLYRQSGQEYVDIIRKYADAHSALSRSLNVVRVKQTQSGTEVPPAFDEFATAFSDAAEPLNGLVSDAGDTASEYKSQLASGAPPDAAVIERLRRNTAVFEMAATSMHSQVDALLALAPALANASAQTAFEKWKEHARDYLAGLTNGSAELRAWSADNPLPWYRAITSFLFGRDWITASFWQDWYGVIPLFVGSFMVSAVALAFAVPFGVAAAIYVAEVASPNEKRLIKPYIEFIAAIPSVVLGFFGIAVVGQAIRAASASHCLKWVSFFPLSERLNIFTAGVLLALMAVPTIFTLSEDALRNVPRGFKEASYALGANRLQTILRVLLPASLSGIVSAILLGLGRVVGETMVVLLCAGNRIQIPDFTEGLGAFFQPAHTMTGIIAQEMGEVVRGSIHYRALFMVGLMLFALTLSINYLAQRLVARFRMSIG
jgi:phosphate transport system permease protein